MSRSKYSILVEKDGWSDWIEPKPGYRMQCCDCGLVHRMEFDVGENGKPIFRAGRDRRATAQVRRFRKLKEGK